MERRGLWLGVLAALAFAIPATPAAATLDACGSPAGASVSMSVSGTTSTLSDNRVFTFSGIAGCAGADGIQIKKIELRREGDGVIDTIGPDSCGPCDRLSLSGTYPATAARYAVFMVYSVQIGTNTYDDQIAYATFDWWGSGQPYRDTRPLPLNDCDPPGTNSIDFAPAQDVSRTATVTGTATCGGSPYLQIVYLAVIRPDGSTVAGSNFPPCASVADCANGTTASVQVPATLPSASGYTVQLRWYGTGLDGQTIHGQLDKTFYWSGLGPAVSF